MLLGIGLIAGLLVAVFTGWLIMLVVLPLAAVGVPVLVGSENETPIERLEAMEEWTRNLSATLAAGAGLETALMRTIRSTPPAIRPAVEALCARIRAHVPIESALRSFADDLDDSTGDLIASALILAARQRSEGLVDVLDGLSSTVADDVRNRRAVEAEREKPRTTARWVTIITLLVLGGLALTGSYVEPYSSPLGQMLLLVLLSAYAGCLIWMRRTTASKPLQRFISRRASAPQPASNTTGASA